ncbi:MAG: SAM-dependent methyltransferase [Ginsengibacter sp.]
MKPLMQNISDTAKWVAIFRADESEKPDAVFHDPFARRRAGEKGKVIADAIEFSRNNSWTFVARTFLFDEFIIQHVNDGYDMVINLASGLDARPYRMEMPSVLKWVEIDLPEIMNYKQNILATEKPTCELRSIQLDLSDKKARLKLFNQLNNESTKTLIVSEGLVGYLTGEEVGTLAQDLSAQKSFKRWVLDMMSPGLLKLALKEMGSYLNEANAPLKFAPEEGENFFLRYGWKHLESKSKLKTAAILKRLNNEMMRFASYPEPEGPKGEFPWSGTCLFENMDI